MEGFQWEPSSQGKQLDLRVTLHEDGQIAVTNLKQSGQNETYDSAEDFTNDLQETIRANIG